MIAGTWSEKETEISKELKKKNVRASLSMKEQNKLQLYQNSCTGTAGKCKFYCGKWKEERSRQNNVTECTSMAIKVRLLYFPFMYHFAQEASSH